MVDVGFGGTMRTPFREQPWLVQTGYALIVVGVVLFCVAFPLHVALEVWAFHPNPGAFGSGAHLFAAAFLTAFLSFGVWLSSCLIRAGYEPRRPGWIMISIAATALAVQLAAGWLGLSKTLALVEVGGIFVSVIAGSVVVGVGDELQEIRDRRSVGGGLGALAGLGFGLYRFESGWWILGAGLVGALLAESLGRTLRALISRRAHRLVTHGNRGG